MKEYTVFSSAAVLAIFILDGILGTGLRKSQAFWVFMLIMALAELAVNGFLTSRPVFLYGRPFISGLKIFTIPIEDFIYGFAFVMLVIVLWEFFRKGSKSENERF